MSISLANQRTKAVLGCRISTDVESERLGAGEAQLLKEMDLGGGCCVGVAIEVVSTSILTLSSFLPSLQREIGQCPKFGFNRLFILS